jgi:hypothetical protein
LAGYSTAAASAAALPGAGRSDRSKSPRGHGYRSPPSLSPPLPASPASNTSAAAGRNRSGSHQGSSLSRSSSSSCSEVISRGRGGSGRASPVPFAATPPTSSWLEVDLEREMDLEHLAQSSAALAGTTTRLIEPHRAASPAEESHSSSRGASPNEGSSDASGGAGFGSSAPAVDQQPAPPLPLPLMKRPDVARLPTIESMLVRNLAARSTSLLAKARTERARLRKLRVLINEASPERLAAVHSAANADAAKARGAAAAAANARDAAQTAAHAAARGGGQADAMAALELRPGRLAALVAAELDALVALSPDDLTAEAGFFGGMPPSRHASRRFQRGPFSPPAVGAPDEGCSGSSSNSGGVIGLGLVSGLLRRIGVGSQVAPSEGCAAPTGSLPSSSTPSARWVTSPAALRPAERWRSAGSLSDDDDFHSADEGDEG